MFLSPHFDDAVLSCGGLIFEFACASKPGEQPVILTVCAGEPPEGPLAPFARALHERWNTGTGVVQQRRSEDEAACRRLGAVAKNYTLPDCIYRRLGGSDIPLIQEEDDLFQPLPEAELPVCAQLADYLARTLPAETALVSPLAIGGHIDHRLVRRAAEMLAGQRPDIRLWYYADYPYAAGNPMEVDALRAAGWQTAGGEFSPEAVSAWAAAVSEYRSQISTFWQDAAEMTAAIHAYAQQGGGSLWRPQV